jgi:hypothetical protein
MLRALVTARPTRSRAVVAGGDDVLDAMRKIAAKAEA